MTGGRDGQDRTPRPPGAADATEAARSGAVAEGDRRPGSGAEARTDSSVETFVGWRSWRVRYGKLISMYRHTRWPDDKALVADIGSWSWMHGVGVPFSFLFNSIVYLGTGYTWLAVFVVALTIFWCLSQGPRMAVAFWRAKLSGRVVQPGMSTPGIFAHNRSDQVEFPNAIARCHAGTVVVRGTVHLWGDTIEHEDGCKGEYAYPLRLTDVACLRCGNWMPIAPYIDSGETAPPLHRWCQPSSGMAASIIESAQEDWYSSGLIVLQFMAPEWFGKDRDDVQLDAVFDYIDRDLSRLEGDA